MAEDLQAQVADLSARLRRVEAERAVIDVLHRYAHTMDYGDWDGWLDCYTDDARYEMAFPASPRPDLVAGAKGQVERHETGFRYVGKAALKSFIETQPKPPQTWRKHVMVEPKVTLDADGASASVRSFFTMLGEIGGERVLLGFGRYRDRVVRCPDGVWRFQQRIAEIESFR